MTDTKMNYDRDADVLYISFGRSEHVTGVEIADNILLRLDTGKDTNTPPRAIGLTFINYSRITALHQHQPVNTPLENIRNCPEDVWRAVITVITSPPVSDFLSVGFSFMPQFPPLPEQTAA